MGDGQTPEHCFLEFFDRDLEGGARQLDDLAGKGKLRVEADLRADCALPSNGGYLDGFTGVEGCNQGKTFPRDRKIDAPSRRVSFLTTVVFWTSWTSTTPAEKS
jgi:hypothetical protein